MPSSLGRCLTYSVALAVLSVTQLAEGSRLGRTGNPQPNCNGCHSGGGTPTVTLTGPTSITTGSTNNSYTVTITGGAGVVGGFNVASNNPNATLVPGTGQRTADLQLTHTQPAAFNNGMLQFAFTLTAPAAAGTVVLTARGNSANNSNSPAGDFAAEGTLTITVTAPSVPDAGTPPVVDAGTPPPVQDAGSSTPTTPTNPTTPAPGTGGDGGSVSDSGFFDPYLLPYSVDQDTGSGTVEQVGCSAASGNPAWLLLLGAGLLLRRRRRQGPA